MPVRDEAHPFDRRPAERPAGPVTVTMAVPCTGTTVTDDGRAGRFVPRPDTAVPARGPCGRR